MKRVFGIRSRILITASVSAFVLTTVASTVLLESFVELILTESSMRLLEDSDTGACSKDPQNWVKEVPGISGEDLPGLYIYAVDEDNRTIFNKDEFPVPQPILDRLIDTPGPTAYFRDRRAILGTFVLKRLPGDQVCRSFLVVFSENNKMRQKAQGILFALSCVATVLVVLITWFLVIRPIVRRLIALRNHASKVGEETLYQKGLDLAGDDIGQISESLDIAHERMCRDAAQLEARRVALEQHLANVAHDLRTPMASLHLVLEDLERHIESETGKGHLSRAIEDSTYLMVLTENLHLASKLSDGMEMRPVNAKVDLGELVERVSFRFSLLGRGRGIEVASARPDHPVLVHCDPYGAERALSNIVHNAVVYGRDGGNVAVVLELEDGRFDLTISDDGPGVAPNELSLLANRTFRSDDARQRDARGNGLGLTITHEIARRAGWSLDFSVLEPNGLEVKLTGACIVDEGVSDDE